MAHPSKRKGDRFEREVVNLAEDFDLFPERAWMSDGRSLGCTSDVDVILCAPGGSYRLQCKRRKSIAQYLNPPDGADLTVIREDYGEALAVVPLDVLFELLRTTKQ